MNPIGVTVHGWQHVSLSVFIIHPDMILVSFYLNGQMQEQREFTVIDEAFKYAASIANKYVQFGESNGKSNPN